MRKVKLNTNRVFRGGSWGSFASYLRAAYHGNGCPSAQSFSIGARLVRSKR